MGGGAPESRHGFTIGRGTSVEQDSGLDPPSTLMSDGALQNVLATMYFAFMQANACRTHHQSKPPARQQRHCNSTMQPTNIGH